MNISDIILLLLLVGVGFTVYLVLRRSKPDDANLLRTIEENARLKTEISQKDTKLGELTKEFQNEKTQKDVLAGKNKQLFAETTSLKAENKFLNQEKERLAGELARFNEEEKRKAEKFNEEIEKLNQAKTVLEDEKTRIRQEDAERQQKEIAERDRMWAEHEGNVQSQLIELCKLPRYGFQTYDNKNLPEGFSGKLKPDFMIEFLDQFVIFDAKVSRSDNLQNYVATNVKTTVSKIAGNSKIYPTVFFIVPTEAMSYLKKTYFLEDSYEFFIISPDAIPVVLSTFKKISSYELAEQMDPRDRENIVNLIAEFDYHINFRNAVDILSAQSGVNVLSKIGKLRTDLKSEINLKKGKMRLQQFTPTELKTLMIDSHTQQEEVDQLISPKAAIPADGIESAKSAVRGQTGV